MLLDKEIEGFGELFRMLSFDEIGASTLQSRCLAGVANGTYLFCLPGSRHACATGLGQDLSAAARPPNAPVQSRGAHAAAQGVSFTASAVSSIICRRFQIRGVADSRPERLTTSSQSTL